MIFTHSFFLPLPPEEALHLFTPVGERAWAGHWDPRFPAGEHGDGGAPGTVFLTGDTHWVVADRRDDGVRYARVTPGVRAGTVEVRVTAADEATRGEAGREDAPRGGTRVDVRYDITALVADDGYDPDLAHWEPAIRDHLASMGDGDRQGDRAVG
jgi:hypothetical protein